MAYALFLMQNLADSFFVVTFATDYRFLFGILQVPKVFLG
jgi:hypothetical protein